MVKLKDIQDQIHLHNESCNKKKLKLPNKISKTNVTEILDSLFSKWVEEKIVFTSSKDTLHPNLIKYLVDNNVCKIKKEERNKNKGWCYLENNSKERINISKQIYFGYQFVEKLRKYKNKKHIKYFFDEEGFVTNLKLEEWVRSWNGVKNTRRLDFIFDIGNDKKIVVEYLEKHHLLEFKNWNSYQTIRLVDIIFGHDRNDIVHFAFIWDHLMDEEYLNKKVKFFCKTCRDHYNIENEEKYIINILNEHIGDKKLSKLFFDAYKNENKPVLKLSDVNKQFKVKKNDYDLIKNDFIELSLLMNKESSDPESETSDDELFGEDISENEDEQIYYQEKGKEIYLSNIGLCLYLDFLVKDNFDDFVDYHYKVMFINKIGKSAYQSANKIRDLIINQKENIISGLNEIK